MIKVTSAELAGFGAERRVGAEFETSLLDQVPARFRVERLNELGAELRLVAWILPNGTARENADIARSLLFHAAPIRRFATPLVDDGEK
jgi:hypothetical protein